MPRLDPVPIKSTRMTQSRLMLPTDANIHGNVHGGMIVKYIDELGGIITARHAHANTVTASIDRMHFYKPVYIGNLLILKGAINYVGTKSMEVGVKVFAEDLTSGSVVHTGSCYSTFVALDRGGNTLRVPPVIAETAEERKWFEGAKERRQRRLEDRERRKREERVSKDELRPDGPDAGAGTDERAQATEEGAENIRGPGKR